MMDMRRMEYVLTAEQQRQIGGMLYGGYVLTTEQQRNEMRKGDMCADHMRQIGGISYG